MDKTNGRVQILDGCLFFSPNCSRTVDLPPPARDKNDCEPNIFLPRLQPNGWHNYFELDIARYKIPRWWSLPFGWIAFFPLYPSFSRPIFEKLVLPSNQQHVFDDKHCQYLLAWGLSQKWLQVDNDLSDAVHIICCHYHSAFIYPLQPSGFGFSRSHKCSGALHMSLRRSKDWFVVWMALLSFVIPHAEYFYLRHKDSVRFAKTHWHDLILQHFNHQWLDVLLALTVCSFSAHTARTGVFLDLSVFNPNPPPPEFFYQFNIPVWYCWSREIANQPKFAHLAPLYYQLQEGTTIIMKSPRPLMPTPLRPSPVTSSLPPAASSSWPKSVIWVEFLTRHQKRYEEHVQKETP